MPDSSLQGKPTREDLMIVYKFLLGREPDDTVDLDEILKGSNWDSVRKIILASRQFQEFLSQFQIGHFIVPWNGPPARVDTEVSDNDLARMFSRIEAGFNTLGNTEPYWAVLTNDRFRMKHLEASKAQFFERGKGDLAVLHSFAARARINLKSFDTCFELGCGVGRVTFHLAGLFGQVIGWDISEAMIMEAKANAVAFDCTNVTLKTVRSFAEFDELDDFDCFFSRIVLQHNPPPVARYMLSKIFAKIRPGGIACFQVPTYIFGYSFDSDKYLSEPPKGSFEMHVLPQAVIFELLTRNNFRVLEVREDGATSPIGTPGRIVSNTFFAQKAPFSASADDSKRRSAKDLVA